MLSSYLTVGYKLQLQLRGAFLSIQVAKMLDSLRLVPAALLQIYSTTIVQLLSILVHIVKHLYRHEKARSQSLSI